MHLILDETGHTTGSTGLQTKLQSEISIICVLQSGIKLMETEPDNQRPS